MAITHVHERVPGGWPILLINMLDAVERRHVSLGRLRSLGLEGKVLRAVDGRLLSAEERRACYSEDLNRRVFKRPLSAGEIGCYLSHYEAWKIAAAGDRPVVVLEDDFEAEDDLPDLLRCLQADDLPDAIIKLDTDQRRWRLIRRINSRYDLVDPWVTPPRTLGYVITPRMARILLGSALPFGRPIDLDLKHWWELGVRVLAVSPGPLRSARETVSQIDDGRLAVKQRISPAKRLYRSLRYQGSFHINLLCARYGIGPLHRGTFLQLKDNVIPT